MTQEQLIAFISTPNRVGTLATANKDGIPNSAVIGSALIPTSNQLVIGLGNNRSLSNLQENPHAVFSVFQEGATLPAWQGARLYLKVEQIDYTGELKQQRVTAIEQHAGTMAAKMISAAIQFTITDIRPLIDFAQS
jgi:hypothetical protein